MIATLSEVSGIKQEVELASRTTWKVGGPAEYFWRPTSEMIQPVLRHCYKQGLPVRYLGQGSNVLIDDNGVSGLVVSTQNGLRKLASNGCTITAGAGVPMPVLAQFAYKHGIGGFEPFVGIPGTIGGGVAMNAGLASGQCREIGDITESVDVVKPNGEMTSLTTRELDQGFRTSNVLEDDLFCIEARFRGYDADRDIIKTNMRQILEERREKQPLTAATAGSTFKNPNNGKSAGWYIDESGLKGHQQGGARVSPVHANWIENVDQASSQDIKSLIITMGETVYNEFGIGLEPEVRYFTDGEGFEFPYDIS